MVQRSLEDKLALLRQHEDGAPGRVSPPGQGWRCGRCLAGPRSTVPIWARNRRGGGARMDRPGLLRHLLLRVRNVGEAADGQESQAANAEDESGAGDGAGTPQAGAGASPVALALQLVALTRTDTSVSGRTVPAGDRELVIRVAATLAGELATAGEVLADGMTTGSGCDLSQVGLLPAHRGSHSGGIAAANPSRRRLWRPLAGPSVAVEQVRSSHGEFLTSPWDLIDLGGPSPRSSLADTSLDG